jgi:hypothetical protein
MSGASYVFLALYLLDNSPLIINFDLRPEGGHYYAD